MIEDSKESSMRCVRDQEYLQESPALHAQVDSKNLVQRYLPKQVDLDKILKITQRKVLKGTHLPITAKEI